MRSLVLTMIMLLGWQQKVQSQVAVTVIPRTTNFPTTATAYSEDPTRIFNVIITNTSGITQEVSLALDLGLEYGENGMNYSLYTTENRVAPSITLSPNETYRIDTREKFHYHFDGRLGTNATEADLGTILQLPEGNYHVCVRVHRKSANASLGDLLGEGCHNFSLCYSASAPELITPISSLASTTPANASGIRVAGITRRVPGTLAGARLSNLSEGTEMITPTRYLNIRWTPVVTNCQSSARFKYQLKIVKVLPSQNINDAIRNNPTLLSTTLSSTTFTYDTIRNASTPLERGCTYACQVKAIPAGASALRLNIGNEGASQVIAFAWGYPRYTTDGTENDSDTPSGNVTESCNQNEILSDIRPHYIFNPTKDEATINALTAKFANERAIVPQSTGTVLQTEADGMKVLDPSAQTLQAQWMPVRHDSVMAVKYEVKLYEWLGSENVTLAHQPVHSQTIDAKLGDNYSISNTTPISLKDSIGSNILEPGMKYFLKVDAIVAYHYAKMKITATDHYVNGILADSDYDTVKTREVGSTTLSSTLAFQWGADSAMLDKVTPAQFVYPVNLSNVDPEDSTYNRLGHSIPEIPRADGFEFIWKKARNFSIKDTATYDLFVWKLAKGKDLDSIVNGEPFRKLEGIKDLSTADTTILDSLKVGQSYVARLLTKVTSTTGKGYKMLNNGYSHPIAFKLTESLLDSLILVEGHCFAGDTLNLSKEVITPDVDKLVNDKVKLKMGRFNMVVQKATLSGEKYSGEGYVEWSPTASVGCGIKVTFKDVKINKDYKVIAGSARSSSTDTISHMNLNFGGHDLTSESAAPYINQLIGKMGSPEHNGQSWENYINKDNNVVSQLTHGIIDGNGVNVGVLTTPIKLDSSILGSDAQNLTMAVNDAYFSPSTAQMNLFAVYSSHEDNLYIPLVATNVCMAPDKFFADSTRTKLMVLQNYEYELADSYVLRVMCPSNMREIKDGTYIEFDNKGFKELNLDAQLDFGYKNEPGNMLLAVDMANNGMVKPSTPVKAYFGAKIKSWKDWTATVRMDAFTVVGCEDWTFVPTGKGILYDHSRTTTPQTVTFPKNYFKEKPTGKGGAKDGKGGKDNTTGNKQPNAPWQGFYMDQFKVFLPTSVSNAFVDLAGEEAVKQDSVVTYTYGANGQIKDSVAFVYPGSRINFSANHFIWDSLGITTTLSVNDILTLETKNGGGWMFSIDTIDVAFTKSKFDYGSITGRVDLPLFSAEGKKKQSGDLRYTCAINTDSLTFALKPLTDTLKLDLFIADVNFTSSFFEIKHDFGGHTYTSDQEGNTSYTYKNQNATTRINCELNGKITIDFHAFGKLPFSLPGIKFENMYLRNYTSKPVAVGKKDTIQSYRFNGTEFNIGNWSKASPQKYFLTSYGQPMDEVWEAMPESPSANPAAAIASGNLGGFSYSIDTIAPLIDAGDYSGYLKAGLKFGGSIGLNIGQDSTNKQDIGASLGFQMWTNVRITDLDMKGFNGKLDSISLSTNIAGMEVEGKLNYHTGDINFGDGWQGNLGVKICNVIDLKMAAGFGKAKHGAKEYDWWFLEGVADLKTSPAVAGPVTFTGFGGGFAYNMEPINGCENTDARELRKANTSGSFADRMVSSGMKFRPKNDAWMAKAGVALILTGAESAMNADGILQLRIANKHFSGISLSVTANVLSDYDSQNQTSKDEMMKVGTFIDFTNTHEKFLFNFSANVEADIDLSSLVKSAAKAVSQSIPCDISYPFKGTSIGDFIEPKIKEAVDYDNLKAKVESLKSEDVGKSGLGAYAKLQIPIDFYYCHYKIGKGPVSDKKDEWFFAIGRPAYNERVMFSAGLNLGSVMNTSTTWTMYFMIGNYFPGGFQLPEIPTDVANMLGSKYQKAKNGRTLPKFENAGGFAFGASFAAELHFSLLLYLDVKAYLGFDAALIQTNGQGCNGYNKIGKNGYYATGQVYAMLDGAAGLELNLGFWKGKLELVSAGMGALLQGGGPKPTWAYGLLAFRARCLGGLIKINTSVDFQLGQPCLPGATDPLANVKLFQAVSPAFPSSASAALTKNIQEPYVMGQAISNLEWGEDIILCANDRSGETTSRKFRFMLYPKKCSALYTRKGSASKYWSDLSFSRSDKDRTQFFFETTDGAFEPNAQYTMHLYARAFEWRRGDRNDDRIKKSTDYTDNAANRYTYRLTGFEHVDSTKSEPGNATYERWLWRNPTNLSGKKAVAYRYQQDTLFYFNTGAEASDLYNQVVYTWPYNGDPHVPYNEFPTYSGRKYVCIYTTANKAMLNTHGNDGKVIRPFLLIQGNGQGVNADAYPCTYEYNWNSTNSVGIIYVGLPTNIGNLSGKTCCVKLLSVKESDYTAALNAIQNAQDQIMKTTTRTELQARNVAALRSKLNAKNNARGSERGIVDAPTSSGNKVDIEKIQLQQAVSTYDTLADTAMAYYRKIKSASYAAAVQVGKPVYSLYFQTSGFANYNTMIDQSGLAERLSDSREPSRGAKSDNYYQTFSSRSDSPEGKIYPKLMYLFTPYTPDDKAKYRKGVVLPPVLNYVLDYSANRNKANIYNLYQAYSQKLLDMDAAIKATQYQTEMPRQNDSKDKFLGRTQGTGSSSTLNTAFRTGLVRNTGNDWTRADLMFDKNFIDLSKGVLTNGGQRQLPSSVSNRNGCQVILQVKVYDEKFRVDSTQFDDGANRDLRMKLHDGRTVRFNHPWDSYTSRFDIIDECTDALCKDIVRYNDFFQNVSRRALYIPHRGWSNQQNEYWWWTNTARNQIAADIDNFPYTFYNSLLMTWYMTYATGHIGAYKNDSWSGKDMPESLLKKHCQNTNKAQALYYPKYLTFMDAYTWAINNTHGLPYNETRWPSGTGPSDWYNRSRSGSSISYLGQSILSSYQSNVSNLFRVDARVDVYSLSMRPSSIFSTLSWIAGQVKQNISRSSEGVLFFATEKYTSDYRKMHWIFDIDTSPHPKLSKTQGLIYEQSASNLNGEWW